MLWSAMLALTLACISIDSIAGDVAAMESGDRPVRVGVYSNPPKIYTDDSGLPAGLFIDLVGIIARREHWTIEFVECDWMDCLERLSTGSIDLMPDVALTESRVARFAFHEVPVVQSWSQIYTLPHQQRFASFEDLRGSTIAVLEGAVQVEFLTRLSDERGLGLKLVPAQTASVAFEMAGRGETDLAIGNHFFGNRNAELHGLIETPITFNQNGLYFAAAESAHDLLPIIDRYLREWKRDPESPYYRAVAEAYAAPIGQTRPDWLFPTLLVAGVVILLLGATALLFRWRIRAATAALSRTHLRLERLLDSSPVVLYALRFPQMQVEWVSSNFERLTGYPQAEAQRDDWWGNHVHAEDRPALDAETSKIQPHQTLVQEYRVFDRDGNIRHIRDEKRLVPDDRNPGSGTLIGSWNDVTAARQSARQINFLSHYDRLTGLPNRSRLDWQLERALDLAAREHRNVYVVLIDLDRFKSINETLGVATGDRLLKLFARRLQAQVGRRDFVARFGNDEFCLVTESRDKVEIIDWLDHLVLDLNAPVPVHNRGLSITASLGVAAFPRDGTRPDQLLKRASQALDGARSEGGNRWKMFQPDLDKMRPKTLFLESDLRQAVQDQSWTLFYQPQINMANGQIAGVEALIRWNHPERGLLNPAEFVPLAEQTGLIEFIDCWAIHEACRQLAAWQAAGAGIPGVSVNLSGRQLYNENLPRHTQSCLAEFKLDPSCLTLELTETMLMEYPEKAREILNGIVATGTRMAMDDFGTGYSNLAYITQLPIGQIKLDQSMVADIESSKQARTLVRGMIGLFRELDLELIAEGIETRAQFEILKRAGCEIGQGFFFGRPVPAERIGEWEKAEDIQAVSA
ncbi:MAG: EAL domain-containing protein [Wenzhouxiangellaceae bacterium]|nr:EAL domain-containing protein [Wenzhouxiangellaceae bacterium]